MYSVPVRCDGDSGIGELKGVLRVDGRQLSLQYQTADPIMHEFRTAPVELGLPAQIIEQAAFHPGFLWLFPRIELRVSDFKAFAALPTPEAGRLRLRLRFGDRGNARKIVDEINAIGTEMRLARLDQSISEMSATLPGRSRDATHRADPDSTRTGSGNSDAARRDSE
jgi:hypothetical protein